MGFRGTAQTLAERVAYIEELIRRLYTRGAAPVIGDGDLCPCPVAMRVCVPGAP